MEEVILACRSKMKPELEEEAFIKIDREGAEGLCRLPGYRIATEEEYEQYLATFPSERDVAPSQKVMGRGYIRVSAAVWPDLGKPETTEDWHKALLLPDAYEVESVKRIDYHDARGDVFDLIVQHPDIPIIADYEALPFVNCVYVREEDKARLHHIEVQQWIDGKWKTVHTEAFVETSVPEEKHAE